MEDEEEEGRRRNVLEFRSGVARPNCHALALLQ
jgi:hypothetical protein